LLHTVPHPSYPVFAIGNEGILKLPDKLAIFCSRRCPGTTVRKVYDLAYSLRAENRTIIGGFQTPMEKECLRVFLNSSQNIIFCPARSIEEMRIPKALRAPLENGRILLLAAFHRSITRASAETAESRNRFAAGLADEILFAHAAPGSSTERFKEELCLSGRTVITL
jgi:predicted Rossmann fold nucleotide-binding protein DprA/Smf involved in DNA uptake